MDAIRPISDVRAHLPEVINKIQKGHKKRCIITRQGKAVAVMISPEELETLEILADKDLLRSLIQAEKDAKNGHLASHEDVFDV